MKLLLNETTSRQHGSRPNSKEEEGRVEIEIPVRARLLRSSTQFIFPDVTWRARLCNSTNIEVGA